jgi:hypothetical protein
VFGALCTLMMPPRSTMKSLESFGGAVTKIGALRPLATCCTLRLAVWAAAGDTPITSATSDVHPKMAAESNSRCRTSHGASAWCATLRVNGHDVVIENATVYRRDARARTAILAASREITSAAAAQKSGGR